MIYIADGSKDTLIIDMDILEELLKQAVNDDTAAEILKRIADKVAYEWGRS